MLFSSNTELLPKSHDLCLVLWRERIDDIRRQLQDLHHLCLLIRRQMRQLRECSRRLRLSVRLRRWLRLHWRRWNGLRRRVARILLRWRLLHRWWSLLRWWSSRRTHILLDDLTKHRRIHKTKKQQRLEDGVS